MKAPSLLCCECMKKKGFTWTPYSTAVRKFCCDCNIETMHISELKIKKA